MSAPAGPPPIPTALVEWLERNYAPKMPTIEEPDRSIWMRTGQVNLVRALRVAHDRQQNPSNVIQA